MSQMLHDNRELADDMAEIAKVSQRGDSTKKWVLNLVRKHPQDQKGDPEKSFGNPFQCNENKKQW